MILILIAMTLPIQGEDINLQSGKVLTNVRVFKVEPDGIKFTHDAGIAKVPFEELPQVYKDRYQFNVETAKAFREQTTAKNQEAANLVREAKKVAWENQLAQIKAEKERIATTPRLTTPISVKGMWERTLPWPKRMEPEQLRKTRFCEYMKARLTEGYFDLEAEQTALQWNAQEYTRVGQIDQAKTMNDQLAQVRVLIIERDKNREEAAQRQEQLALQAAGVAATQNIAEALNGIAFQMLLNNSIDAAASGLTIQYWGF
jgi:hypothetical protein